MREAPSFKNNLLSTDARYHIKVLQVTITANLCLVVIMLLNGLVPSHLRFDVLQNTSHHVNLVVWDGNRPIGAP